MPENTPRNRFLRWASPTENSPWALLRGTLAFWTLFALLWISWQFWGDGSALRRVMAVTLTLVSIVQSLNTLALMHKKRQRR